MAATFTAIRAALADTLRNIPNMEVYTRAPDTVNVPCAIVEADDPVAFYSQTEGTPPGLETWRLRVLVLANRVSAEGAQDLLDGLLEPTVVKQTVELDPTLAGTVVDARVDKAGSYGTYKVGDVDYLGVRFFVTINADSGVH